jgi:hypothetical protein
VAEGRSRSPRWARVALLVLLVACGALRLAYASVGLHYGRFYDEKFSLANVDSAIRSGTLRPANAFYPSLSYLPQTALVAASHGLYRFTGWQPARVLGDRPGVMTATAFFLSRLVQVAFGLGVIALTFVIGRRLFDPPTGLLAALLVAVMPNQIRLSSFFKPDILVTLLVLVAFLWTLEAARSPSRWRFLLVGVAVGLATAAKYTGVAAALPLVLLAVLRGFRQPRLWWWSVQAGVASLVAFLVVNPHLGPVLEFLPRLGGIYESKGAAAGVSHPGMLWEAVKIVVAPAQHGLVLGVVALLGLAGLVARACDRRVDPQHRVEAALLGSVPIGFVVAYAAASTLPKVNNYLQITPFTALAAAWLLRRLWVLASERSMAARWRRPASLVAATGLVLWLAPAAATFCLDPVIPTTVDRAQALLEDELRPYFLRSVFVEQGVEVAGRRLRFVDLDGGAMLSAPERLTSIPEPRLDAADAEVFVLGRGRGLDGPDEELYRARVERVPREQRSRFEARSFLRRGPSLMVLRHPWQLVGEPIELRVELSADRPGVVELRLPEEVRAGDWVSLSLWLPRLGGIARELEIRPAGGEVLATARTRARRRQSIYQTERFEVDAPGSRIEIRLPEHLGQDLRPRVEVWRWLPPNGVDA